MQCSDRTLNLARTVLNADLFLESEQPCTDLKGGTMTALAAKAASPNKHSFGEKCLSQCLNKAQFRHTRLS